jgi:ElaB/YqjD/DUF883 family membrane-anchored ribosome-binding protein
VRSIIEGVSLGVGKRELKIEKTLSDTVAGMDDALLKVVQASNVALHRLTGEGHDFEDSNLKRALDELEKLEDEFLRGITAAADSAGEKIREPWERVLKKTKGAGTATGAHAAAALRDYAKRAQAAVRLQRETGFKAAYLLTQNFAILVSGILIGMSEGLGASPSAQHERRRRPRPGGRRPAKRAPPSRRNARRRRPRSGPRSARRGRPRASPARITRGNCSDGCFEFHKVSRLLRLIKMA